MLKVQHPTAASAEDVGVEQMQQPSSDSSSDSDYDVQLARKIKQRSSYQVRAPAARSMTYHACAETHEIAITACDEGGTM